MSQTTKTRKSLAILLIILAVLIISFVTIGVLAIKNANPMDTKSLEAIIESNVIAENVFIDGIDVSNMDEPSVRDAISPLLEKWYTGKDITFTVEQTGYLYNIKDFGVTPDVENLIKEVFEYSSLGTIPDGVIVNESGRADFHIKPSVDLIDVMTFLQSDEISEAINIAPASNGIFFRPQHADESQRFEYSEPIPGIKVNIENFSELIVDAIKADDYSVMQAPCDTVSSFTSIEDMKLNTQLIGSYTSELTIKGDNRDKNVQRMATLLCQNMPVIYPGEQLSLNGVAGMRTAENGFFEAPGLTSGVHDLQYGGGVCQISSTVYIAALEAELQIDERHYHSLPSDYIPVGLDATISETPDLKITNNTNHPIYMSIVVDIEKRFVTCSFYGKPPAHGYTVQITNKLVKTTIPDPPTYEYATSTPGGTSIKPLSIYEYIPHTYGQRANVYRQYLDSEGNVVKCEKIGYDIYDAFSGVYYLNPNESD